MTQWFKNKIAVITGGGSGIGKEAARVVINGRDQHKLQTAASEIDSTGLSVDGGVMAGR